MNTVVAGIIRPPSLNKIIGVRLVGCGDPDAPMPPERHKIFAQAPLQSDLITPVNNPKGIDIQESYSHSGCKKPRQEGRARQRFRRLREKLPLPEKARR